jgi:hypothetical protein
MCFTRWCKLRCKKYFNYRRSGLYWIACSAFICNTYPDYQIFNLDALTYAGNLENLKDIEKAPNSKYAVPSLYFYDHDVVEIAKNIPASPRGEF